MDRDEIEFKANKIYIAGTVRNENVYANFKAEILAEHDRLTAEVERLRWHYPARGELPDEQGAVLVFVYDETLYLGLFADEDITFCNYGRKPLKLIEVERWRYIE